MCQSQTRLWQQEHSWVPVNMHVCCPFSLGTAAVHFTAAAHGTYGPPGATSCRSSYSGMGEGVSSGLPFHVTPPFRRVGTLCVPYPRPMLPRIFLSLGHHSAIKGIQGTLRKLLGVSGERSCGLQGDHTGLPSGIWAMKSSEVSNIFQSPAVLAYLLLPLSVPLCHGLGPGPQLGHVAVLLHPRYS